MIMYEFQKAAKPAECAYDTADEKDMIAGNFPVSASRTSGDEVRFDGSTSACVTLDGDDDVETIADLLPGTDYRLGETVPAG